MRWKWTDSRRHPECSPAEGRADRIRADLERRGLSPEAAERLGLRIEDRASEPGSSDYEALLDGIALVAATRADAESEMGEQLRDLKEIERLMSGFSQELSKLDEVLEVLAAHVRRMRVSSPTAGAPTLH